MVVGTRCQAGGTVRRGAGEVKRVACEAVDNRRLWTKSLLPRRRFGQRGIQGTPQAGVIIGESVSVERGSHAR
ncbi:hypothetical protein GCM10023205_16390 [Yinghuangia aomiensis]|uniref:Uncharacterized protein n=1 Tax=Yinghuangia aomiensis TaxID=676205 RepID=A0ABP9GWW3_9ACTN